MNDQTTIDKGEGINKVDLSGGFIEIYDQGKLGSCAVNAFCALFNYHLVKELGMAQPTVSVGLNNCLSMFLLGCLRNPVTNQYKCIVADKAKASQYPNIQPFRPSRYFLYYYACILHYIGKNISEEEKKDGGGTAVEYIINSINKYGILKELPDENNNNWQMEKLNDNPTIDEDDNKCNFKYNDVILTEQQKSEAKKWSNTITKNVITKDNKSIKQCLDNQQPLLISMHFNLNKNASIGLKTLMPSDIDISSNDGHMMVIVGYDDNKKLYKIRNSWSAAWGYGGYCYLSYDFFPEDISKFDHSQKEAYNKNNNYKLVNSLSTLSLNLSKYG